MNRVRSNSQRRQDPPVPIPSATRQPSAGSLSSDSGSYPSEFAWQPDPWAQTPTYPAAVDTGHPSIIVTESARQP